MESESHPSAINQGPGTKSSRAKEGLSVYGLFQRFAHTPQGRNRLKQIFLRPSIELDVIRERHAFISVYLRPENYNPLEKLVKSLKHIKNLHYVMVNLRKGISTGSGKITGFKTTVWATLLAVRHLLFFMNGMQLIFYSLLSTGSIFTRLSERLSAEMD